MQLQAVVFDFDGLIVDSESAGYQAWQEEYRLHGHVLDIDRWQRSVGTVGGAFDPAAELQALVGSSFDHEATDARRRARWAELTRRSPVRAGIRALIGETRNAGLPLAIASSSRHDWVAQHLQNAGLLGVFEVVVGRDDVGDRPKPAPDVYVEALRRLDVTPERAVALEDSRHGVTAALAAGLPVIAVPNPVTAATDLGDALLVVETLDGFGLADLVNVVQGSAAARGATLPRMGAPTHRSEF